jgi:hypothetical protein
LIKDEIDELCFVGDHLNLSTIDTTNIVPVELNAILYRSELTLAALIQHNRSHSAAGRYLSLTVYIYIYIYAFLCRDVDDIVAHMDDYITNQDGLVATFLQYAHRR